jgi:hypothetical protein
MCARVWHTLTPDGALHEEIALKMRSFRWNLLLLSLLAQLWGACDGESTPHTPEATWQIIAQGLDEAVLSVGGSSSSDVWAVGADKGQGPLALHWNGKAWTRMVTGSHGDLWWVHGFVDGTALFGGAQGTLLRWTGEAFERVRTPGLARHTIFGVWGRAPNDFYAVGSIAGRSGFIWHDDGTGFRALDLPASVPSTEDGEAPGLFKVWGNESGVYVVGSNGVLLTGDARRGFAPLATGKHVTFYTVFGDAQETYVVGGDLGGVVMRLDEHNALSDVSPSGAPVIQGVSVSAQGEALACGATGQLFTRSNAAFTRVDTKLSLHVQTFHSVWFDPEGNAWAVGGNAISGLDQGAIVRRGAAIAGYKQPDKQSMPPPAVCPPDQVDPEPTRSIARRWDEQILGAIRRDLPRPTVHARNLYHLSAAMWDAWAAYDSAAKGVFVDEKHTADDLARARLESISYAAHGVLQHRYGKAANAQVSLACFDAFMKKLGLDVNNDTATGDTPSALGNRIARTILAGSMNDGSNEANNYGDTTGYESPNPPLVVDDIGTDVVDPEQWQPLNLTEAVTQNGIVTAAGVQGYVGAQWEDVTPFALTRTSPNQAYHDPGDGPHLGKDMQDWVKLVIERTSQLDVSDGVDIDISPAGYGNNSLGHDDGQGRATNPVTGKPYTPELVPRGDFARVLAEFWADGPKSETPPGHWNVMANNVADAVGFAARWRGQGEALDALSWDVRLYLALNGALHDAAITAWGIKRHYTSSRPITLIRYMAGKGQSSDPKEPHYDPEGLPLVPGLIELITEASVKPGQRHAHLARHVGEIAVRSYRGEPSDRAGEVGGVAFIRALEWIPYQRRTFVTPAFPGFISGHSTFSRAAAEVLTGATGSPYFPNGLAEFVAKKNEYLVFEQGPSVDVHLQWASYYDAADQAGQSRLYGGIHITPDDLTGRKLGSLVGSDALAHAETFFGAP